MERSPALEVPERSLIDQAFTRAVGAERIEGNRVRLLRDGAENYPAWHEAIASARRTVYFETYYIRDDSSGCRLAEALSERARAGVVVRVLYDWVGALGKASARYWSALRDTGVEVRCFNPPRPTNPLDWVQRNHRKSLVVDGREIEAPAGTFARLDPQLSRTVVNRGDEPAAVLIVSAPRSSGYEPLDWA